MNVKDRRTNMINSSMNAQPAKEGAGGSYVWGSPTSVTDFEAAGTTYTAIQTKKFDVEAESMDIQQDAYVHDDEAFPAMVPAAAPPSRQAGQTTYSEVAVKLAESPGRLTTVSQFHGHAVNQCEHPDQAVGGFRSSTQTEVSASHAFAGDFSSGYAQMPVPARADPHASELEPGEPMEFQPDHSWEPLTSERRQAKVKAVRKEGGKLGVDLEGASHMGNTQFFCSYAAEPEGDHELVLECLKAMNAPEARVVRAHQERSGCAGNLAKMVVSANPCQIRVVAHVPKALQESLAPEAWLEEVMAWYGGDVVQTGPEICVGLVDNLNGWGLGYEINLRHHSTDILQRLGLMAQADHAHHHDDEVFGDDHLPGMSAERKKSIFQARKSLRA